jgi:hypothetical protein
MPPSSRRQPLACETLERRACPAVVTLAPGFEIGEAEAPQMLTVSLDAPAAQPVTVSYSLSGTATPGADFQLLLDGRRIDMPLGRLTFAPGETQKQLAVVPVNDTIREGDESFTITLRPMGGVTIPPLQRAATVTIIDNDTYDVRIIAQSPDGRLQPGRSNELIMQLVSPRTGQVVSATRTERFYLNTRNGSAVAGADYMPFDRLPVTFGPGQTEQRFRVNVLPNGPDDFNKAFFITTDPFDPAVPVPPVVRTVVVGPRGDPPPPSVSFVQDVISLPEGNTGDRTAFTFVVQLDIASEDLVTVDYATRDGSATLLDRDYVETRGTLTFLPGERRKTVTVPVIGDRSTEPDEEFFLDLSNPQPAGVQIVQATAKGVILDDEVEESGFQIDLVFADSPLGPVPEGVRALAREAADRWSRIIVGNLPSVEVNGVFIDDFEMTVQMGLLNGPNEPGGVLAQAGPTEYRGGGNLGLPYRGITGLDPFDVTSLDTEAQRNFVLDVITHEIGHALGFTPGAAVFTQYVRGDVFVGPNALREYSALFQVMATGVPLETEGGTGTAGAHWLKSVFGPELLTGSVERIGTRNYISRVTIGALEDLGYDVNYGAAEPYVPPRGAGPRVAVEPQLAFSSRAAVDLTGNGVSDLVWQSADGAAVAWIDGNPEQARRLGGGGGWSLAATGDFNGDGVSDLVWRSPAGQYVLWVMEPAGGTSMQRLLGGGGGWSLEATGDYDGDGKTDLVWRNSGNGVNVMWLMDGATATRQRVVGGDHTWRLVVTDERFDANGDGRTDLVWRNASNGANVLWTMHGATKLTSRLLGGDHTWQITGAGDFDGDGRGDLLWRNSVNGAVVMHLLDDGQVRQSRLVGGDLTKTVAATTTGSAAAIYWRELGGAIVRQSLAQAALAQGSAPGTRLGGDAVWRLLGRPGQAA